MRALARLRTICLAYPEASERLSHGMPAFFVREKITFAMLANDHHGDGRLALWCAAPPGAQAALVASNGERFFKPPYVGVRGWIGVRLEKPDWTVIADAVEESFRCVAPRKLVAVLDARARHGCED